MIEVIVGSIEVIVGMIAPILGLSGGIVCRRIHINR